MARALVRLGNLQLTDPGQRGRALALIEEGRTLYRELGHMSGLALSLRLLGAAYSVDNKLDQAVALLKESAALSRKLGDKGGAGFSALNLAAVAIEREDYETARGLAEEGYSLYNDLGNKWGIAGSQGLLSYLSVKAADYSRAAELAKNSLAIYRELEEKIGIFFCLMAFARVAEAEGNADRAVRLMAAADDMRKRPVPSAWSLGRYALDYEAYESRLREKLGAEAYDRAWALGRSWTLAESIAYALEEAGAPTA
jgi:hypothetical protein